jgi:dihydrofolate reductase
MGRLIYTTITSLDGYVADETGSFEWAAPDEDVHAFVNDLERPTGTYLCGRRLYEVMQFWESADLSDEPEVMRDYAAIWQSADKVVYSTTLTEASTARTQLRQRFDADEVRAWKSTATRDLSVGGPGLAAAALRAGLVDEVQQLLCPVVVGGGTHFLPAGLRLGLELQDVHGFAGGVVYLRYAVNSP